MGNVMSVRKKTLARQKKKEGDNILWPWHMLSRKLGEGL